jgi:hypothetical protein
MVSALRTPHLCRHAHSAADYEGLADKTPANRLRGLSYSPVCPHWVVSNGVTCRPPTRGLLYSQDEVHLYP